MAELKAGDRFIVRYLDGKWRSGPLDYSPNVSPDSNVDELFRSTNAAVIMWTGNLPEKYLENEGQLSGMIFGRIPSGTAARPFTFTVPKDGVYRIVMADKSFRDNSGTVSYEVKIYRNGAR